MANGKNGKSFSINIPPFEGDGEELEFFFRQVSDLASINKWTNLQTVAYVRANVRGPARDLFLKNETLLNATTLTEVISIFKAFFQKKTSAAFLKDFNALVFNPSEPLRQSIQNLEFITKNSFPNITDTIALNAIKFSKLLEVLPKDFKLHLLQNKTTDFDVAKNLLIEYADIKLNYFDNSNLGEPSSSSESVYHFNQMNSSHETEDALGKKQPFLNPAGKPSKRDFFQSSKFKPYLKEKPILKCQYCSKLGHTARFCFQISGPKNNQNNQNFSRNQKKVTFSSKQFGHNSSSPIPGTSSSRQNSEIPPRNRNFSSQNFRGKQSSSNSQRRNLNFQ